MDEPLEMSETRRERIQERISRAVICGESAENLQQIIDANQLSPEMALAMTEIARKERVRIIRDHYMRYLRLGSFLVALGMAAIYGVLMLVNVRIPAAEYLGLFIVILGLALIILAVAGIVTAPSKKGSFADRV